LIVKWELAVFADFLPARGRLSAGGLRLQRHIPLAHEVSQGIRMSYRTELCLHPEAELVDASGISETICNDRDGNKFIECAIAGQCKLIVSGDKHLLNVSEYKGVMV